MLTPENRACLEWACRVVYGTEIPYLRSRATRPLRIWFCTFFTYSSPFIGRIGRTETYFPVSRSSKTNWAVKRSSPSAGRF